MLTRPKCSTLLVFMLRVFYKCMKAETATGEQAGLNLAQQEQV